MKVDDGRQPAGHAFRANDVNRGLAEGANRQSEFLDRGRRHGDGTGLGMIENRARLWQAFQAEVAEWIGQARDPRFGRPYTELTYQPMHEIMAYLGAAGFAVYIVTGGGQDFVRVFAEETYGIARNRVIGSVMATRFGHDASGLPVLTKIPALTLNNDLAAKPEGIHMMIGRRPTIAFGNSAGDEHMLDYATGGGAGMGLLLLHDDAVREYAYGPATGLPDSGIGSFPQALYDRAMAQGWTVISMRNDWNRIFAFE